MRSLLTKLLLHPGIRSDALAVSQHLNFARRHVRAGAAAFLCWLVYVIMTGSPGRPEIFAGVWLISPLIIALLPRLTGSLRLGDYVSVVNVAAFVTYLALITGGSKSFLLIWLAAVPLQAAMAGSRRLVAVTVLICALALLGIMGVESANAADMSLNETTAAGLRLSAVFLALACIAGFVLIVPHSELELVAAAQRMGARYRLLADHAVDMISLIGPDGRAHFVSSASEALLGFTPQEMEGNVRYHLIHPDDRELVHTKFYRGVHFGESSIHEYRVRRKDGQYIWIESRCRAVPLDGQSAKAFRSYRPVRGSPKARYYLISVARDISARKRQEAALREARDEANRASHAKSRFLAGMSHELRTPLNAILGFSQVMKSRMFGEIGDQHYAEYVEHIHQSGEHLRALIDELLDLSKIEAGKYELNCEALDVAALIEGTAESLSICAVQAGVHLHVKVQPDLPPLIADPRAVRQMLLNLLSNALKFTPREGHVTLSARLSGETMILEVCDTGIGIPADELDRLGHRFQQAPSVQRHRDDNCDVFGPKGVGTGLGLAMVKSLARLHGGQFDIASVVGKGTSVRIRLPAAGPDK